MAPSPLSFPSDSICGALRVLPVMGLLAVSILALPGTGAAQDVDLDLGDLPPGQSVTITFDVTVTDPLPAGLDDVCNQGTVTATGGVSVMTDDPDSAPPADETCLAIDAEPFFTLTKTYMGTIPQPGDTITFDLGFVNLGDQGASGTVLTETVPVATQFNAMASTPGWVCPAVIPGTVCTFPLGLLGGGGVTGEVFFAVDLDDPLPGGTGSVENCASIEDDDANGGDPFAQACETVTLDAVAPTVVAVRTLDPIDAALADCAITPRGLRRIGITFSEPMFDPAGNGTMGDVTNPAGYLIVGAGPDLELDTTMCGPLQGDDVAIPVDMVTYDGMANRAALDLNGGGRIPDAQYRIFACPTLQDPAGNPLDGNGDGTGGDEYFQLNRVDDLNLLINGHFDCDLGGWTVERGLPTYQTADADAVTTSGSAQLADAMGGTNGELSQCVPVGPGLHELSLAAQVDAGDGIFASLATSCSFFAQPDCATGPVGQPNAASFLVQDTGGGWIDLNRMIDVPQGANFAFCAVGFQPSADAFDGRIDRVTLSSGLIFADGFETGNTSNWSGEVP